MSCADKIRPACLLPSSGKMSAAHVWLSIFFILGLTACDRLGASRSAQLMQDADTKSAQGDFARAVNLYEAALDDSPRCSEVHYKLALLHFAKVLQIAQALERDPEREQEEHSRSQKTHGRPDPGYSVGTLGLSRTVIEKSKTLPGGPSRLQGWPLGNRRRFGSIGLPPTCSQRST